jgi:DNA-binding response OmpR family regulator
MGEFMIVDIVTDNIVNRLPFLNNESQFKDWESMTRFSRNLELTSNNNVLIVEDDVSLAGLLINMLEEISPNIHVDWATSGEEAEQYLQSEGEYFGSSPYDLVIADIFLEGQITGLDIWKLCDRKFPDTHILVTSSLPVEKFVSCLKNEFSCPQYLPKPFTLTECKEAISEFL